MAKNIFKQIGGVFKDEAGEFVKQTKESVADNLEKAGKEAISSITGMEIKDGGQNPAELEQLKKIGEQKEKEKNRAFPELREILKQQQLEQESLKREKNLKQQMSAEAAQKIAAERQKKMGSSMNPLDVVGQKLTGMKAIMFKNKKETKQQ